MNVSNMHPSRNGADPIGDIIKTLANYGVRAENIATPPKIEIIKV